MHDGSNISNDNSADAGVSMPYRNDFAEKGWQDDSVPGWKRVQEEFEIDIPEPEEVIIADYDIDGYEGSANILYREGDKFFYVQGGHCSCYGLEGQWEPEEYSRDTLLGQITRAEGEPKYYQYGFFRQNADLIRKALDK